MNGDFWLIKTDEQKANAAAAVSLCAVNPQKPMCVQIKPYKENRSQAQNRLAHKWYLEISEQGKEYTPEQVKCRCKYHYGIPLMVEDEVFSKFWDRVLSTSPTYEQIVDEIMPITPVTSLMDPAQMSQYLTDVQRVMSQKYRLTDPSLYGL